MQKSRTHRETLKDLWLFLTPTQDFYQCYEFKRSFVKAALSHFSHWVVHAHPDYLLVWLFGTQLSLESLNNTLGERKPCSVQNIASILLKVTGWPGRDYFILEWCQVKSPVCPRARGLASSFLFLVEKKMSFKLSLACKHLNQSLKKCISPFYLSEKRWDE